VGDQRLGSSEGQTWALHSSTVEVTLITFNFKVYIVHLNTNVITLLLCIWISDQPEQDPENVGPHEWPACTQNFIRASGFTADPLPSGHVSGA
jgi:hypothetical protein